MRAFSVLSAFIVLAGAAAHGAAPPEQAAKPPATAKPAAAPTGNLAQVMRGTLFPNANILFDVQSGDPETFGKKAEP
jgi:hypothetical protein